MAALPTNVVPTTGLRIDTLLTAASSGGDDCQTGAGVLLIAHNTDTASKDITLATPQTVDGLAVADRTVTVPATTGITVIPVTDLYRNPATGRAQLTYPGGVTGLTVCVVRVPVT